MQDIGSDRVKRRRLNGDDEAGLVAARERMLQAAAVAGSDGVGASGDISSLLLRQRLLEQHGEVGLPRPGGLAFQQQLARYNAAPSSLLAAGAGVNVGSDLLAAGAGASATDLLAAGGASADLFAASGGVAGSDDPMVNHLRQNLINQQLQQAARLQAAAVDDPLSGYLRASEAAAVAPSSLYASLIGGRGAAAAAGGLSSLPSTANSLLLEHALQQKQQQEGALAADQQLLSAAAGRRGSAVAPSTASYMQSLLDAERENEATAAAALAADGNVAMRARLLGLPDPTSASSMLARIQNERAALLGQGAAAGLGAGVMPSSAFAPSALDSLIARAPSASGTANIHRDLLFARGVGTGAPPPPSLFLSQGLPQGGAGGKGNAKVAPTATPSNPNNTGRQPIHLYMSCDDDDLSPYQCLVRKQIELFEAQEVDAETNARGRNRPIVVGQVGIRCKHCKMLPPRKRERAAIYYPSKLDRLYQAGQTMASVHLGQHCNHIPAHIRTELARLREGKSAALAGKKYWSDGARALGVIEEDERLFFRQQQS